MGLLLPEGALEASVAQQLRNLDPDLRLVPQNSDAYGRRVYKVYKYMGSERPAQFILMWGDENGNPFPLSSQLVEEVKRHDRNQRGHDTLIDEDAWNPRLEAERRKQAEEEIMEIGREYEKRISGKSYAVLPRSPSLAAARRRQRRKNKDKETQP